MNLNQPGVYRLVSPNGEDYIGRSGNILRRMSGHILASTGNPRKGAPPLLLAEFKRCHDQGHRFPDDWQILVLDPDPEREAALLHEYSPSLNMRTEGPRKLGIKIPERVVVAPAT